MGFYNIWRLDVTNRLSEAYSPIVRGFDAETAELDACRIEHDLSRETFEKLKACWETIAKGERKP